MRLQTDCRLEKNTGRPECTRTLSRYRDRTDQYQYRCRCRYRWYHRSRPVRVAPSASRDLVAARARSNSSLVNTNAFTHHSKVFRGRTNTPGHIRGITAGPRPYRAQGGGDAGPKPLRRERGRHHPRQWSRDPSASLVIRRARGPRGPRVRTLGLRRRSRARVHRARTSALTRSLEIFRSS